MDFIVEDGTGLEGATSYSTVEFADDWIMSNYPDSEWEALTEPQKEIRLMRASMYLDGLVNWRSNVLHSHQGLMFPREPFQDNAGRIIEGLPKSITVSAVELANLSLTEPLVKGNRKVLLSQSYGNSSETYAQGYVEGESGAIQDIIGHFLKWGYGSSASSVHTIYRA